jgi:hypothetical protein
MDFGQSGDLFVHGKGFVQRGAVWKQAEQTLHLLPQSKTLVKAKSPARRANRNRQRKEAEKNAPPHMIF